jgi:hypothetical protein
MARYFDPNAVSTAPMVLEGPGVWHGPKGDAFNLNTGASAWGGQQQQRRQQPSGWGGGGTTSSGWGGGGGGQMTGGSSSGWGGGGGEQATGGVSRGWGGGGGDSSSHSASTEQQQEQQAEEECSIPIVNVSGRLFPVETVWIEEAFELLNPDAIGAKTSSLRHFVY